MTVKVAVLDYGIGNLRSAQKALQRVGADAVLTADPAAIEAADAAVLPGVGNFGACMRALHHTGLSDQAKSFAGSGRPFLGICVGMQLLYETSEESPEPGLGLLKGSVVLLPETVKRPQMQWNRLNYCQQGEVAGERHPLFVGLDDAWMYFVHSYAATHGPSVIATVDHGGPVTAAVAKDNVWATQFHPEKSAQNGLHLLKNWLDWVSQKGSVAA